MVLSEFMDAEGSAGAAEGAPSIDDVAVGGGA